jgi:hypothetical protein
MGSHPKRPRDFSQAAKLVIDIATGERPNRDPTPEEGLRAHQMNRVLPCAASTTPSQVRRSKSQDLISLSKLVSARGHRPFAVFRCTRFPRPGQQSSYGRARLLPQRKTLVTGQPMKPYAKRAWISAASRS